MSNPIFMAMQQNKAAGIMGPLKQAAQTVRAAQDPNQAVNLLLQRSPYGAQARQLIQQYGSAENACRELARQNGIDMENIMNQIFS
jgi:hypothetical protein